MWSWPFFYALLISQLFWFIPCNRSEFFTYIAFSATPSTFTFISRCIFHSHFPNSSQIPYIPHILPATSPSIWEQEAEVDGHFFLQFLGRSHIALERVTTNLTLTITKLTITRCMYFFPKGYGGDDFWGQLWDAPPVARIPIPITFHPDFLWPLWNEIKMRSRCFPRTHPHPFHQSWSSLKPFSSKLMIVHHTPSANTNFQNKP